MDAASAPAVDDQTAPSVTASLFFATVSALAGRLSVQTFVLPLLLIIVTSIFLLDTWAFGGRFIVWGFAVLMGSSILYNSFCRETR